MEWLMGPPGIIIVVVILILIVGPKQLPKLGKQLGSTMKSVRTGLDEMNAEMKSEDAAKLAAPDKGAAPAAPDTLVCPKCGMVVASGTKFCPECGAEIKAPETAAESSVCPTCGATVTPGAKFCPECGASL